MNLVICLKISERRISDFLHGHASTYSPWLHELTGKWNSKRGASVVYDRAKDEEGSGNGKKTLYRIDIERGLSRMAERAPSHFGNFIDECDDAITFDVAWQYIIFGKVVYG